MANSSCELTPTRRTSRVIKPSLKAKESIYATNLKSVGLVASLSSSEEEIAILNSSECEKPKILHEDEAVKGEEIFAFEKRKQRESLAQKIRDAIKTPKTIKNKLKNEILEVFEDSGSEYEISEEEEESSLNSEDDGSNEDDEVLAARKSTEKLFISNKSIKGKKLKQNSKYTIDTDEFFANAASNKLKTSNNTLDKLQTPRLPQFELQKLLTDRHSQEHIRKIKKLNNDYKNQFKKWLYILSQKFSILLYGLGSKKEILLNFHKEFLQDELVIVINGYFPGLTIKNILDNIIEDLLELKENPSNLNQAIELIISYLKSTDTYFYMLINNIEAIKGTKAQSTLAALISCSNIYLIASIDHINAPLIWDHNKLSKFNFTWWDVTSFLTYQHETECELSSMTQQNNALALSSVRNVFISLTQNSKAIYLKLAKYQIEHTGQYYQGMAFKDLYMACREGFIVSSDLALRAQLSEFIDHKMVKTKRSVDDGTEYLIIPLANSLLQQFIEENP